MDGFELIAAVRRHDAYATLPVVLLTSSASPGDQKRGDELKVAARLLKPVKQSLLLDNLMQIMHGTGRDASVRLREKTDGASTDSAAMTKPLRVLLAEDNAVNVKFALKVLERAGHQVTVAGNGKQAVELWQSTPFDLILMDIQMPEMDGLEATQEIRRLEKDANKHTPIIAMTANAMTGDREMCLNAGMDGYVAKPVKRDVLMAEMARITAAGGHHVGTV
jgi:two-component system sensor histidine kinase/response regulator